MAVRSHTLLGVCQHVAYRIADLIDTIETVEGAASEDPSIRQLVQCVNDVLREINRHEGLRLQNNRVVFNTIADYETGTVDVTQSSTTVTGTSTVWTSVMAGRLFFDLREDAVYRIASVESATSLTLESAYVGDTSTGISYRIGADRYEASSNLKEIRHAAISGNSYGEIEIVDPVELAEGQSRGTYYWGSRVNDVGTPRNITVDFGLSSSDNFFYVLDPIPDDIFQVRLLVDLQLAEVKKDGDIIPIEDGNIDVLRDGTVARFKMIEGETDADDVAWEAWIERGLNRFLTSDRRKTDASARIVPADVMRGRNVVGLGRVDWKDR